jgi:hypothetical protein
MDSVLVAVNNLSDFHSPGSLRESINPLIVMILTAAAAAVVRALEKHRMNKKRKY